MTKKKETKPRKPTRTQQLELDKTELARALETSRAGATDVNNKFYKANADLADERALTATLRGEVRGLKVSITNLESKYMEQKGRADALELALRFAQKVAERPEKGAPTPAPTAQEKATIDAARRCVSNMMAESFGTPRRPY